MIWPICGEVLSTVTGHPQAWRGLAGSGPAGADFPRIEANCRCGCGDFGLWHELDRFEIAGEYISSSTGTKVL